MFLEVKNATRQQADRINEAAYQAGIGVRGFALYQVESQEQRELIERKAGRYALEVEEVDFVQEEIKRPHLLRAHIARASSDSWRLA